MAVTRWAGLAAVPAGWDRSVVTIGVFDGVHRGHQYVIGRAAELGRERGLPVVVVTFDPNPVEIVRPGSHPTALTSVDRRVALLGAAGADAVLIVPFTRELSRQAPADFVVEYLVNGLNAAGVVVGRNFRYGYRAAGDLALLERLGVEHGFSVDGLELVGGDSTEPVSSTHIRELVERGDVAGAATALGRPHRVEGLVVEGDRRGRELGFPTANLETAPHAAVPADGVYAGWLIVSAQRQPLPAAISIGTNPTFRGTERRVEGYAIDRADLELYGQEVAVDFADRLRDTVTFDSVDALVEQIHADVAEARWITTGPIGDRP